MRYEGFWERLGRQYSQPFQLFLLGGSALCFLGGQRRTVDIDCTIEAMPSELEAVTDDVAQELQADIADRLGTTCDDLQNSMVDISETAMSEGLTQEQIETIFDDFISVLEDIEP